MAESHRSGPPASPIARADGADAGAGGTVAAPKLTLLELTDAFTTYGADLDLACGTLRQCAAEIYVLMEARRNGCAETLIDTVLLGIAQRMELAAKLASEEASL